MILTSENRIVVIAFSGKVGSSLELIELDTDGRVLGRMPWQTRPITNFALTTDGHLYSFEQYGKDGIDLIDVAAGTVRNLESPSAVSYLMGADGNDLVYRVRSDGQKPGETASGWFPQPAVQ